MIFHGNNLEALDLTLSALENEILAASDAELLASDQSSPRIAAAVSALVAQHLAERTDFPVPYARKVRSEEPPSSWVVDCSIETLRRIEVLRRLVAMRPDVPPQLRAAFSADRTPSSRELDYLTEELRRVGILPRGESDKS